MFPPERSLNNLFCNGRGHGFPWFMNNSHWGHIYFVIKEKRKNVTLFFAPFFCAHADFLNIYVWIWRFSLFILRPKKTHLAVRSKNLDSCASQQSYVIMLLIEPLPQSESHIFDTRTIKEAVAAWHGRHWRTLMLMLTLAYHFSTKRNVNDAFLPGSQRQRSATMDCQNSTKWTCRNISLLQTAMKRNDTISLLIRNVKSSVDYAYL